MPLTFNIVDEAPEVPESSQDASQSLTAASREYPLARVERDAMSRMRDMMQRHLTSLGVTAAFNPADLITDQMEAEYLALAVSLWEEIDILAEGFGLDTLPLDRYYPMVKEAIETSRNRYIDVLKSLIGKQADATPVYGEFFFAPDYVPGTGLKPPAAYEVQFGDVRSVLGELGGGSGGEVPLASGVTGGRIFSDVLAENGLGTEEKLWLYGETARRSFNGHMQIDGLVFTDWADEALEISPQDRWIRTDRYRPGDHWGCACVVVPYVPNFGDPFTMTLKATVPSESRVLPT